VAKKDKFELPEGVPPPLPLTEEDTRYVLALPSVVDSPIEERLLVNLIMFPVIGLGSRLEVRTKLGTWKPVLPGREDREVVYIELHPKIGDIRPDFAVGMGTDDAIALSVLVECDGHDFHEKTKEQVRRDKQRDRGLALAGFTVLRFAGSEIHKDPMACAQEIYGHILARFERLTEQLAAAKKPGEG
jgi:hypothetical protein